MIRKQKKIKTSHIHVVLKPPHKNVLSGTLPLGLAGSGTYEKFRLTLELFKYRPLGDALTSTYFMNAAVLST